MLRSSSLQLRKRLSAPALPFGGRSRATEVAAAVVRRCTGQLRVLWRPRCPKAPNVPRRFGRISNRSLCYGIIGVWQFLERFGAFRSCDPR
eukprot:scaffold1355_cov268-Pinguiococcus_pyrenoidosus.AAC.78